MGTPKKLHGATNTLLLVATALVTPHVLLAEPLR